MPPIRAVVDVSEASSVDHGLLYVPSSRFKFNSAGLSSTAWGEAAVCFDGGGDDQIPFFNPITTIMLPPGFTIHYFSYTRIAQTNCLTCRG